jgi:hypothetical protein
MWCLLRLVLLWHEDHQANDTQAKVASDGPQDRPYR